MHALPNLSWLHSVQLLHWSDSIGGYLALAGIIGLVCSVVIYRKYKRFKKGKQYAVKYEPTVTGSETEIKIQECTASAVGVEGKPVWQENSVNSGVKPLWPSFGSALKPKEWDSYETGDF